MGRFIKDVEGVDHHYQPDNLYKYAGEPFDVRVSILDEPPDGALWVQVPEDNISRSIEEILDELVIGKESQQTEFIRENLLELDEFPHLSDALDWVSDIWHRFRAGESGLNVCVNNGPDDIALQDTPREHMCSCVWRDGSYDYMLLDLVFEPDDMTLLGMLGERKQEFLQWMKGLVALYKLDIDSSAEKQLRKHDKMAEAREQLFFHNLISKGTRGKLSITQQGRRAIGRLIEEQEELIARFDVFRDVVIRKGGKGQIKAEFGTLSGADYRVAVYKHEGIDPFRSVFLLTLLSGDLEEQLKSKDWVDAINDDRFYESILAPVVDHSNLDDNELDHLVQQGTQYLARTAALRERSAYSQGVLQRAKSKTIQAFPRKELPEGDTKDAALKEENKEKRRPFTRASKSRPSDELGAPPLPEDRPPAALPAGDFPPPPDSAAPPTPNQGMSRSSRRFRGQAVPSPSAPGPRGRVGVGGGRRGGPATPMPPKKPKDEDDGWL